jgi:hypothetical protein
MYTQSGQAESLYDALFDWQAPFSLWERAEKLKNILGDELLASRDVGRMDIKKILEGWVIGKTLSMTYHREWKYRGPCLVRVADIPSTDGQLYKGRGIKGIEVTQALHPTRKRNVFGTAYGGLPPQEPIKPQEEAAYLRYRDHFFAQAFHQIESRIEHKFQLYQSIDYLLVYVDLFDMNNPRFSYFALEDFAEECADELEYRLQKRFREHWGEKIGHLFLLDDKKERFVTRFGNVPVLQHEPLALSVVRMPQAEQNML